MLICRKISFLQLPQYLQEELRNSWQLNYTIEISQGNNIRYFLFSSYPVHLSLCTDTHLHMDFVVLWLTPNQSTTNLNPRFITGLPLCDKRDRLRGVCTMTPHTRRFLVQIVNCPSYYWSTFNTNMKLHVPHTGSSSTTCHVCVSWILLWLGRIRQYSYVTHDRHKKNCVY